MKSSIILPTYKEKDNIVELIQVIFNALEPEGLDFEVVVVDDNRPDGTAEAVRQNFDGDPRVKLFVRTSERGLATAIRYGVEHSTGQILVSMDTDFNHDPQILPQMIKFLDHYDIIIGSRFVMAGGMEDRFRQFSSLIYNYGIRLLFRTPVHDNLSGFFPSAVTNWRRWTWIKFIMATATILSDCSWWPISAVIVCWKFPSSIDCACTATAKLNF